MAHPTAAPGSGERQTLVSSSLSSLYAVQDLCHGMVLLTFKVVLPQLMNLVSLGTPAQQAQRILSGGSGSHQ